MAIVVDIIKYLYTPDFDFGNRYVFQLGGATLEDPVNFIQMIATHEQTFHSDAVVFYLGRLWDTDSSIDSVSVPLDSHGDIALASQQMIPPILVARVQLGANMGREGQKYYHVCVGEDKMANGKWDLAYVADVEGAVQEIHDDAFNDFDMQGVINPTKPTLWVTSTCAEWVGTHQFRKHKAPAAA